MKTRMMALLVFALLIACHNRAGDEVVVYTALDQEFSEPILKGFTQKTGIQTRVKYDTEAAKTTGLVSTIIEEAARPRCDVFWNNEILRTIQLEKKGLLAPYVSPQAASIRPRSRTRQATGPGSRRGCACWPTTPASSRACRSGSRT